MQPVCRLLSRLLPLQTAVSATSSLALLAPQQQQCTQPQQQHCQRAHPLKTIGRQTHAQQQPISLFQQQLRQQHSAPEQRPEGHQRTPDGTNGPQGPVAPGQQQVQQQQEQQQRTPDGTHQSPEPVQQQQQHAQQGTDQEGQGTQQQDAQQEDSSGGPLEGPNGLLLEWRTESASWFGSMFHMVVKRALHVPESSTWSVIHRPHYHHGFLWRLLVAEGASLMTWPLQGIYRRQELVAEFLFSQAHADFDIDSFKQGVKQALEYSTSLYAASDWVTLKPLVATALLQSMQEARERQAGLMQEDDVRVSDVDLVIDPESVRLVSASCITRDQLSDFDQQRARDSLPLVPVGADDEESGTVDAAASAAAAAATAAAAAPVAEGAADHIAWDLAHVYAEGVLYTQVSKGSGPAAAVNLPKRGHYILCRGPVHADRVLSADVAAQTPWFLLCWL